MGDARNITNLVTWSSSDTAIAQVSLSTRLLVAVAPGSITNAATMGFVDQFSSVHGYQRHDRLDCDDPLDGNHTD
jgi:hypothetical protein